MINIKELNGRVVKKELNSFSASFRWHNKNNHGGNFGINIYFAKDFNRETDKEITGDYDKNGNIYSLSFSPLYSAGGKIPICCLIDIKTLFDYIRQTIAWEQGKSESPQVDKSELLPIKDQLKLIGFEVPE